jgi:hypothetical protein
MVGSCCGERGRIVGYSPRDLIDVLARTVIRRNFGQFLAAILKYNLEEVASKNLIVCILRSGVINTE